MTTKNIVTDYGAVADAQWLKAAFTMLGTQFVLHGPSGTWNSGDLGKTIVVGNAAGDYPQGGAPLVSTISSIGSGGASVTLNNPCVQTLPFSSGNGTRDNFIVSWGTDSSAAFVSFRNEFAGQTVTLTIPAGVYLITYVAQLFAGITNITVNMTGATICGGPYALGAGHQLEVTNIAAKTVSVIAGSTSITCLTPSQASRFIPDQYGLMTGSSAQYAGYPSNHYLFEPVKIISANTSTGVVTFTPALANTYLSTWPEYLPGYAPEGGGPAMLYPWSNGTTAGAGGIVGPSWDHTEVINGGTWVQDAQFSIMGRSATLNGCTFPSDFGPYPTMLGTGVFINCTCAVGSMEYDKYVANCTFTGCSWHVFNLQSANDVLTLDSTSTELLVGTSRVTTIRNGCNLGRLQAAPIFGYAKELNASDSVISQFGNDYDHLTGSYYHGGSFAANGVNFDFTMSGGVITVPSGFNAYGLVEQWAHVGARLFWFDPTSGTKGLFTILAVTQDTSNMYVHTDWPGGFPPVYNKLSMLMHPAPAVTFTNVTGCPEVVDLSGAPAGVPLWSYTKRTYTGTDEVGAGRLWPMYGVVKKLVVDVTTPYTGVSTGSSGGLVAANLGALGHYFKTSDWSELTFVPIVNLKTVGTRTLDTSGGYPAVWTGLKTGDTLPTLTSETWAGSVFQMNMPDVSSEGPEVRPVFTVELITDQGFGTASAGAKTFTLTFV